MQLPEQRLQFIRNFLATAIAVVPIFMSLEVGIAIQIQLQIQFFHVAYRILKEQLFHSKSFLQNVILVVFF